MNSKCKLLYFSILILGIVCWIIVSQKLGFAADSTKIIEAGIKSDTIYPGKITDNSFQNHADCININTASNKQLISLHGIGPVLSERIVDYRKKNGKFKNASELIKVKGIGKGKLQKIKDRICF